MKYTTINTIYFSATKTTQKIVEAVAVGTGLEIKNVCNLVDKQEEELILGTDEIAIIGIPVYSGRVPALVAQKLKQVKGTNTPAILVCVYGNRNFDDALVELQDLVIAQGFVVISAAAFIAQHAIFPKVASGRPDTSDLAIARDFGKKSLAQLFAIQAHLTDTMLMLKGNRPYRAVKDIPLKINTKRSCNGCKICARQCPSEAINWDNPRKTDAARCILCAQCIMICPRQARHFGGLIYWLAALKYTKASGERVEPTIYI